MAKTSTKATSTKATSTKATSTKAKRKARIEKRDAIGIVRDELRGNLHRPERAGNAFCSRTHAIHLALCEATKPMTGAAIAARATEIMKGPKNEWPDAECKQVYAHLRTMGPKTETCDYGRGFIESVDGGFVLTKLGRESVGAKTKALVKPFTPPNRRKKRVKPRSVQPADSSVQPAEVSAG